MGWRTKLAKKRYQQVKGAVHHAKASYHGLTDSEYDEVQEATRTQRVVEEKNYAQYKVKEHYNRKKAVVRQSGSGSVFGGGALNEFLGIGSNVNKNFAGSFKGTRSLQANAALIGLSSSRRTGEHRRKKKKKRQIVINLR